MNIKDIVKSQRIRHLMMKSMNWVPDRIMLPFQYWLILHRWPNLAEPKRFTEWIQYYKMNYRNPILPKCVDKYSVRDYVREKLGSDRMLTTLYQVCKRAEEIDYDLLPKRFVIKTTNGGNGDNVLIVRDKNCILHQDTNNKINSWLKKNYSTTSREWAYSEASRDPKIIVEEYLEPKTGSELNDYKFFCFNGVCKFFKIDSGRFSEHKATYFSPSGELIEVTESKYSNDLELIDLSQTRLDEMISIAEKISRDLPFVRVDLYDLENRIVFGEMTFYPMSGYGYFTPDSFDYEVGRYFSIAINEIIQGGVNY